MSRTDTEALQPLSPSAAALSPIAPPGEGGPDAASGRPPASWRGWVVTGVALAITPVGYLGNEGISPLVALGGLLTLTSLFVARRPALGVWILAALTAWAAASFAWSPLEAQQIANLHGYNHFQALTAPKLVFQFVLYGALLATALTLGPQWRRRVLWILTVSVVATIALLVVEGVDGGSIYERLSELVGRRWSPDLDKRNAARGCYGAAVLMWPAAAVLWRRGYAIGGVGAMAASALGSLLLGVDAPVAALIAGLGAFFLVRYLGRLGVWACLAGAAFYFLAAPWPFLTKAAAADVIPRDVGKLSWHLRLDIWRFASGKVVQHPLIGWGLDSSRAWPDQIPMHPHDAAIQLWLETGVVGVVLAVLFFAWLFWRIAAAERLDRSMAAVMAATVAAYLMIGAISFGVWQEWWIALGVFAMAACAMLARSRLEESQSWGDAELVELGEPAVSGGPQRT